MSFSASKDPSGPQPQIPAPVKETQMFLFLTMLLAPVPLWGFQSQVSPTEEEKAPEQPGPSSPPSLQAPQPCQELIGSTELNEPSSLSTGDCSSLTSWNNPSLSAGTHLSRSLLTHLLQ